jgi:hypothetical protein
MARKKNLIGQKFHKLTVIQDLGSRQYKHTKHAIWLCKCDCGKEKILTTGNLKAGTQSCGCLYGKHNIKPDAYHAKQSVYNNYLQNAKRRGYEFQLTVEDVVKITSLNCIYCNEPPKTLRETKTGNYTYNGIDRVDNTKGYTLANCVASCRDCNCSKLERTREEFLEWIKKVYERHFCVTTHSRSL